ncbi:Alpha/beta hydrolase family protein [Variovorax boronicumulans]|nr:Alpha/beta hydrolase family protein [Variovorax boronicumulans]
MQRRTAMGLLVAALLQATSVCAEPAWLDYKLARPDGSHISYRLLSRQPATQPTTLLVAIQGSDCNSVAHNQAIQQHLINVLPAADVLVVEKYGLDATLPHSNSPERPDCPAPYLHHDNPIQRTRDLSAVIADLLRTQGYRKIVAVGGSEGATVAMLLAANSSHVDATIAFSGGGRWFRDDLTHSVMASDMPAAQKPRAAQGLTQLAQKIVHTPMPDLRMSNHGESWWKGMLGLDMLAVLQTVRTPVLLIQGGRDDDASPQAALALVAQLHQAGQRNVDYLPYPTLDHRLAAPDKTSRFAEVVKDMNVWLRRQGF